METEIMYMILPSLNQLKLQVTHLIWEHTEPNINKAKNKTK
jgi:hypothetical protein